MIPHLPMTIPRFLPLAALALLAACHNPREDARGELHRLRTELDQHRARFGRYPDALDPRQPASAANLPFAPRKGVAVRLVHAGDDGIQALARQPPWSCSLNVDPRRGERIECTPLTITEPAPAPPAGAPNPMDSVLRH